MPSKELIDLLQKGVAREIQVSIQYMWQHVRAAGMESAAIADELKAAAITEMKHAEELAERLDFFGVEATTNPDPITVGESLREMLTLDKKAEEEAIALYKQGIKKAVEEDEYTTRRLFEKLLEDEEEHLDLFSRLLE